MLLLRGAQTPGELNTNSGRLHEFSSLSSVHEALDALRTYGSGIVKELPRQAGQKETRFVHLLGETPIETEITNSYDQPIRSSSNELESRVSALEAEVAELKEKLRDLLG